jgi:hypothetical protein
MRAQSPSLIQNPAPSFNLLTSGIRPANPLRAFPGIKRNAADGKGLVKRPPGHASNAGTHAARDFPGGVKSAGQAKTQFFRPHAGECGIIGKRQRHGVMLMTEMPGCQGGSPACATEEVGACACIFPDRSFHCLDFGCPPIRPRRQGLRDSEIPFNGVGNRGRCL